MAAKDIYHEPFKRALSKAGWKVTHDPLVLPWGRTEVKIDLGAEQLIAAEREDLRIAIEIKSFISPSPINDLEKALGQFVLYLDALSNFESTRILYLAVTEIAFYRIVQDALSRLSLLRPHLRVIVFDPDQEVILEWIPEIIVKS